MASECYPHLRGVVVSLANADTAACGDHDVDPVVASAGLALESSASALDRAQQFSFVLEQATVADDEARATAAADAAEAAAVVAAADAADGADAAAVAAAAAAVTAVADATAAAAAADAPAAIPAAAESALSPPPNSGAPGAPSPPPLPPPPVYPAPWRPPEQPTVVSAGPAAFMQETGATRTQAEFYLECGDNDAERALGLWREAQHAAP